MRRAGAIVLIGAVIVALVVAMSVYTVDQRKAAINFQLGEVIQDQYEPGLYFLVPLLQNVRLFDTRIQTLEARDPERFLTSENRNVLVDSFVKWKVVNVRQYYVSVRGDPIAAEARISQTVNDALRAEFAKRTVHDVVSGEREQIMTTVVEKVDKDLKNIGVRVIDVRLKRVDFVPEISSNVYDRMNSERKRVANELRATGQAEGVKIKADADRQRRGILAERHAVERDDAPVVAPVLARDRLALEERLAVDVLRPRLLEFGARRLAEAHHVEEFPAVALHPGASPTRW